MDTFSPRLIASGLLDSLLFAAHRFELGDTMAPFDTFADAANTNALKVVSCGPESTSPSRYRADTRNCDRLTALAQRNQPE